MGKTVSGGTAHTLPGGAAVLSSRPRPLAGCRLHYSYRPVCAAPPASAHGARAGASRREGLAPACCEGTEVPRPPGHSLCLARLGDGSDILSPAGALISHDKLLLQTNPERELGSMGYQLGQVSTLSPPFALSALPSAPCPPPSTQATRPQEQSYRHLAEGPVIALTASVLRRAWVS